MYTHFYAAPAPGLCGLLKSPTFPASESTPSGNDYEKKNGQFLLKILLEKSNRYMREALNQKIMTIFKA